MFVDTAEISAFFKANSTEQMLEQLAATNPLEVGSCLFVS